MGRLANPQQARGRFGARKANNGAGTTRRARDPAAAWAEHLERSVKEVSGEPAQVVDTLWRPIAAEQLARRCRDEPLTSRLLELPGVSRRSTALLGPFTACLSA